MAGTLTFAAAAAPKTATAPSTGDQVQAFIKGQRAWGALSAAAKQQLEAGVKIGDGTYTASPAGKLSVALTAGSPTITGLPRKILLGVGTAATAIIAPELGAADLGAAGEAAAGGAGASAAEGAGASAATGAAAGGAASGAGGLLADAGLAAGATALISAYGGRLLEVVGGGLLVLLGVVVIAKGTVS